jgi:hypothetical protein
MTDDKFESSVITAGFLTALILILLSIKSCDDNGTKERIERGHRIVEIIQAGADPLSAYCSLSNYTSEAVCAIRATK